MTDVKHLVVNMTLTTIVPKDMTPLEAQSHLEHNLKDILFKRLLAGEDPMEQLVDHFYFTMSWDEEEKILKKFEEKD